MKPAVEYQSFPGSRPEAAREREHVGRRTAARQASRLQRQPEGCPHQECGVNKGHVQAITGQSHMERKNCAGRNDPKTT